MSNRALALACALALAALPAPARADGGKVVDIKTADGTLLKGTFTPAAKPGPGVLLLHMCNSQRTAWAGLAPLLAAKGIHVLAIDYRGYGESGGSKYTTWTPEERRRAVEELWPADIDRAFDFLVAQPGVDKARIGAAGGSCGVNNAVQLSRRHPEVKTLVLLAGGTNQAGQEHLAKTPWLPIFAVAAFDDGNAVDNTEWTMRFSSNPLNQMRTYPQGGHGTEIFAVQKDLEPAIAAWFEKYLVTQPVRAAAGGAPKPGPSAQVAAKLREPGATARAVAEMRAGRRMATPLPPEGVLNELGYELLQAGRAKDAIEVFALNVEAHPESANVHDSISDAYAAAKDKAKTVEHAKKALELLATDPRSNEDIKKQIRESCEKKIREAGTN